MSLNGVRPRRPEQCRKACLTREVPHRLNGVRPRRPEQLFKDEYSSHKKLAVSMESGLEGRNNPPAAAVYSRISVAVSMESGLEGRNNGPSISSIRLSTPSSLNGVRPRRPEQSRGPSLLYKPPSLCLNGVRPRRPEQSGVDNPRVNTLTNRSQWSPA